MRFEFHVDASAQKNGWAGLSIHSVQSRPVYTKRQLLIWSIGINPCVILDHLGLQPIVTEFGNSRDSLISDNCINRRSSSLRAQLLFQIITRDIAALILMLSVDRYATFTFGVHT